MRLLATLLIALSLATALVSASSAYLVDLGRPDGELVGLTLNEDVRRVEPDGVTRTPVAKKGAKLDPELLADLRAASARRVRVEKFEFGRWEQRWIFLLALLGLGGGAFLVRRASAAALAATRLAPGGKARTSPGEALAAIEGIVEELLGTWDELLGSDSALVLDRLSAAIDDHAPAFVANRDLLVARMGLGSYATLMDRFAAAERQLHRAWSAAADDVLDETRICLERARVVLEEARAALGTAGS